MTAKSVAYQLNALENVGSNAIYRVVLCRLFDAWKRLKIQVPKPGTRHKIYKRFQNMMKELPDFRRILWRTVRSRTIRRCWCRASWRRNRRCWRRTRWCRCTFGALYRNKEVFNYFKSFCRLFWRIIISSRIWGTKKIIFSLLQSCYYLSNLSWKL